MGPHEHRPAGVHESQATLFPTWAIPAGGGFSGVLSPENPSARYQPGGQAITWVCAHRHDSRPAAEECAEQELSRQQADTARGGKVPAYPTMTGSRGDSQRVTFGPSEHYASDWQLELARGSQGTTVHMSARDMHRARALMNQAGDLDSLVAQAREAGLLAEGAGLAAILSQLVTAAHAAGYDLAAQDMARLGGPPADSTTVTAFLEVLLDQRLAPGSVRDQRSTHLTQAVRDVIELLQES
jgi:hypothetical protein